MHGAALNPETSWPSLARFDPMYMFQDRDLETALQHVSCSVWMEGIKLMEGMCHHVALAVTDFRPSTSPGKQMPCVKYLYTG